MSQVRPTAFLHTTWAKVLFLLDLVSNLGHKSQSRSSPQADQLIGHSSAFLSLTFVVIAEAFRVLPAFLPATYDSSGCVDVGC